MTPNPVSRARQSIREASYAYPQSVMDALADAETLRSIASEIYWADGGCMSHIADAEAWGEQVRDFCLLASAAIVRKYDTQEVLALTRNDTPRWAARAAFRAVPGLRAE